MCYWDDKDYDDQDDYYDNDDDIVGGYYSDDHDDCHVIDVIVNEPNRSYRDRMVDGWQRLWSKITQRVLPDRRIDKFDDDDIPF